MAAAAVAAKEEVRKGPWTEQEDLQLVCYVSLFGERRWDFLAKVSGLKRTGKSCRLRWVNYLHPGLKRGRLTPQEERLVLEFHSRWGNRWSRIARKLPGRTDNEIKNYWRTHMRKKAQERKRNSSLSSFSSSSGHHSPAVSEPPIQASVEDYSWNNADDGVCTSPRSGEYQEKNEEGVKGYPMDQIWKEIARSESVSGLSLEDCKDEASITYCSPMASPMWEYCSDALWKIDDEEPKLSCTMGELPVSNYLHGILQP